MRYEDAPVTATHEKVGLVAELMNPFTGALKLGATAGATVSTTNVRDALHAPAAPYSLTARTRTLYVPSAKVSVTVVGSYTYGEVYSGEAKVLWLSTCTSYVTGKAYVGNAHDNVSMFDELLKPVTGAVKLGTGGSVGLTVNLRITSLGTYSSFTRTRHQ